LAPLRLIGLPGGGKALLQRVNLVQDLLGRRLWGRALSQLVKGLPREGRLIARALGGREALLRQGLIWIKRLPQDAVDERRLLTPTRPRIAAQERPIQVGHAFAYLL